MVAYKDITFRDAVILYKKLMECDILSSQNEYSFSLLVKIHYNLSQLASAINMYEDNRKNLEIQYGEDSDEYKRHNDELLDEKYNIGISMVELYEAQSFNFTYDTIKRIYFMINIGTVVE